jgi:hypothetical protein
MGMRKMRWGFCDLQKCIIKRSPVREIFLCKIEVSLFCFHFVKLAMKGRCLAACFVRVEDVVL